MAQERAEVEMKNEKVLGILMSKDKEIRDLEQQVEDCRREMAEMNDVILRFHHERAEYQAEEQTLQRVQHLNQEYEEEIANLNVRIEEIIAERDEFEKN